MKEIYADHAATTPLNPKVLAKMMPYFTEDFGNASSLHSRGERAKKVLLEAKKRVAGVLGCEMDEVIFTSGGTESDNLALKGIAEQYKSGTIITSCVEHHAILHTCEYLEKRGFKIIKIPVDSDGVLCLNCLEKALKKKDVRLVSIMYANNEVGSVQPIKEIAKMCHAKNVIFHTDAVQAGGALDLNVKKLGVDMMSLSGHKFYGPQGIGVLYKKKEIKLQTQNLGGGQEYGIRAGTENLAGIVGFSFALEMAEKGRVKEVKRLKDLRDGFVKNIMKTVPDTKYNGHKTKRLPGNAHFCFTGAEGESILMKLRDKGVCVSTASACSSESLEPSHVLCAMCVPIVIAHGSCRFSFGHLTKASDIKYLEKIVPEIIADLREMSPIYQKGMLKKMMDKVNK